MEKIFQEFVYKCDHKSYPAHSHIGYQIIYLNEGTLSLAIGRESLTATAPCFIFFNTMEQHSIIVGDGSNERYLINVSPKTAQSIVRNKTLLSFFSTGKDTHRVIDVKKYRTEFESILKVMLDFHTNKLPFYAETVSSAFNLMLSMLHSLNPKAQLSKSNIQIAVDTIKEMLENDPKTEAPLKELAMRFHFNEYYLLHSFKEITGYNIKQFQMMCRLALAYELLQDTKKNITDVCFESGFSDVSNFTRYFKNKTSRTPTEYRKFFWEIN